MFYRIIEQCAAAIERIESWMGKAEAYAAAEGFDVTVLMNWRLAPDMGDFVFQIRIACNYLCHAVARLSDHEPPAFSGEVNGIVEAHDRIRRTLAFVRGVERERFKNANRRMIKMDGMAEAIDAETYFVELAIPNIHFHVGLAYAILRQAGLELGKRDFLGPIYPG